MKQFSLGKTLNLFISISIIVPLILISAFAMYYSTSFLNELSRSNNLQVAESIKNTVDRFFEEPARDLQLLRDLLGHGSHRVEHLEHFDESFEMYHKNQDRFSQYYIVSPQGVSIYTYPEGSGQIGFDYSTTDFFKAIHDGEDRFWTGTYVDNKSGLVSIDYAIPIQDYILVGTIRLESLRTVLESIIDDKNVIIGITDSTGVYIVHSDYANVEQRITDPYVNQKHLNYDLVTINNMEYYGTNLESKYQGWDIVLYEHVSKQQDKVVRFMILLSVMIVVSTTFVILTAKRINRMIVDSLSAFVSKTKDIASGNYSSEMEKSRFKEFGEIGNNVTIMAREIQNREQEIRMQNKEIEMMNLDLEQRVKERTLELSKTNEVLEETLENLNETREQLIESEKLASLGNLVAGLAHEINTPLGIILTVVTYMQDTTSRIIDKFKGNTLKKDDLVKYTESMQESEQLIFDNVTRTTELIGSFKMISSDQMNQDIRRIKLGDYIENIIVGLEPNLKKSNIQIAMDLKEDFEIITIPGSVYQVMVNLIMNAALHGYGAEGGKIDVKIRDKKLSAEIVVQDYGMGISEENLKHIFEPFFTTARGAGGTGLGLNITYNAIRKSLKGSIGVESKLEVGTKITVVLPKNIQALDD